MKHLKKIVSILLTAVMVLAMCISVMATEGATNTYTITAPDTNHQYEIYQIFTGNLHENTLSNIKWGNNGTGTKGEVVSEGVINALTAVNGKSDKEKLAVIKGYANLKTTPLTIISKKATYPAVAGYYLIKDVDKSLAGKDESYTTYIVKVVGDVEITPKSNKPSSEKKVKDINDSTGVESSWQDSADYDIGDKVPFQLKGTVASNYDDYTTYKFVFHDQESAGLTFDKDSVKVYVGGKQITSGYTVNTPAPDGDTFDVTFANLKDITDVVAGSVITVEYESQLNEHAVIGSTGNPNNMHLEYSNNPNDAQGGETGNTPNDKVIVFTYKVTANKTDANDVALKGAAFALYKKDDTGAYQLVSVQNATENNGRYTLVNSETTEFNWAGLDDGEYKIVEVVTPAGYNTMEDLLFTVTAEHDVTSDDPRLTSLSGGNLFTGDVPSGTVTTAIKNYKGSELPETGGIGTTIFYVVGVVLMLGAGVLLITKRRMSAKH